ncbi:MAG: hypothetical protein PHY08_04120 [Candidatus Cloacimonetes bacterium]|nr:hypothetical protein [Candidatus Cloacimonadota bacterium]
MKKSLFLAAILLISLALCATVEISGDARTRMSWNNWFDPDSDSKSIFDSRAQIQFKVNPAEDLYFVYMLRAGNYVWGDKANTGVWSKKGKLVTRHLYFDYNGFEDMNIRVGLLPWLDHKSLVLDDDLAGVIVSKKFNQDMTLEVGYGQVYESDTAFDGTNDYNDADVDAFLGLISFDMSNMYGVNTIIKSYKINKSRLDLWFMPYFNYNLNGLQIDAMGAYNYGSYTEAFAGKDVTNGGYAFSLDLEYNLEENGIAGLNFLYSSGDDGEDPESTTAFNTLSSYYMNGLEYMGIGINDSHPSDFYFDANNNDAGIMSIVGRYAYPFTEKFTGRIAAGMVSAIEGEETAMATEINIGACYMLYENVSLDAVGAYVMPGKYYQYAGEDGDNAYEVSTRINVKF